MIHVLEITGALRSRAERVANAAIGRRLEEAPVPYAGPRCCRPDVPREVDSAFLTKLITR